MQLLETISLRPIRVCGLELGYILTIENAGKGSSLSRSYVHPFYVFSFSFSFLFSSFFVFGGTDVLLSSSENVEVVHSDQHTAIYEPDPLLSTVYIISPYSKPVYRR
jgi:hypothetical protein